MKSGCVAFTNLLIYSHTLRYKGVNNGVNPNFGFYLGQTKVSPLKSILIYTAGMGLSPSPWALAQICARST